jgi:hypothetical protein
LSLQPRPPSGTTGVYRRRHGNLRRDGAEAVLRRALADGPVSREEIYFGSDVASISELPARFGKSSGARVYFDAESVRYRWLDRRNRN